MKTSVLAIGVVAVAICATSTLAVDRKCDAESISAVKAEIDGLPEGDMKKMATDHVARACRQRGRVRPSLLDGRWWDAAANVWRNARGRPLRLTRRGNFLP